MAEFGRIWNLKKKIFGVKGFELSKFRGTGIGKKYLRGRGVNIKGSRQNFGISKKKNIWV